MLALTVVLLDDVSASAAQVVPLPRVTATSNEARDGGVAVVRVRSLLVQRVPGVRAHPKRLKVSCNDCPRRNTPIVKDRPTSDSSLLAGVNWLLREGRGIKVTSMRPGYLGRFVRLAVGRRDGRLRLIRRDSGCLDGRRKPVRCPPGVRKGPSDGKPVPELPAAPPEPPAPPAPPAGSPAVEIQSPPGDLVPACWTFRGTADLPAGKTLVLGVRNLAHTRPITYFETVSTWHGGTVGRGAWSQIQFFGSGDSSVGQTFELLVLVMTQAELQSTLAAHGSTGTGWEDPVLPAGAERAKMLTLDRQAGTGQCS